MKDIEKKLKACVINSDNTSPIILKNVKARIQSEPIPEQEVKKTKNKLTFRRAFGATVSSFAVVVLCVISILITIALNIKAYAPAPDNGNDSYPDDSDDLFPDLPTDKEISLSDYFKTPTEGSAYDYATENGIKLLYLNIDCDFYLLTAPDAPDAYLSVYSDRDITITVIQTFEPILFSDIFEELKQSQNKTIYEYTLTDSPAQEFVIYEFRDKFIGVSFIEDAEAVYVNVEYHGDDVSDDKKDIKDIENVIDEMSDNYAYLS